MTVISQAAMGKFPQPDLEPFAHEGDMGSAGRIEPAGLDSAERRIQSVEQAWSSRLVASAR